VYANVYFLPKPVFRHDRCHLRNCHFNGYDWFGDGINRGAYETKDSLNVGITLVSATIMIITLCILPFTDKTKDITLNTLDANISVNNSMVTINPLPKNYSYNTLDNNTQPKSDQKQVFKYVENTEYDSAYLISEDGGKFKLSDEDREYLKERGVR